MRILIVDDDPVSRRLLSELLTTQGHEVLVAADGRTGTEMARGLSPDLIILDVQMPVMDGIEAARVIKNEQADRFVPIIFLTASHDEETLARCLAAGGDDFVSKPCNVSVLRAKIQAMTRIRELTERVHEQNRELERHHEYLRQEIDSAQALFAKMLGSGALDAPCLAVHISPASLFMGDLVLAAHTPQGGLHVLVGDFTGHGLPAAVGAIPTAETFYAMTAKGFSIGDIVEELNRRLRDVLVTGMFCAASLLEIDSQRRTVGIWNGGLPPVLVLDEAGRVTQRVESTKLPLGIQRAGPGYRAVEWVAIEAGTRFFLHTDGLTEATDARGELFGGARLEASLAEGVPARQGTALLEQVLEDYTRFAGPGAPADDVTCAVLDPARPLRPEAGPQTPSSSVVRRPGAWQVALVMEADALRQVDPMPVLMNLMREMPGPREYRERIYTVMAELFANALEHGVLLLDSAVKEETDGFRLYYEERERRLRQLTAGRIEVQLGLTTTLIGGELRIRVSDSGPGFTRPAAKPLALQARSGRGLTLIRALCRELVYHDGGSTAEAVFAWEQPALASLVQSLGH